MSPNFSKPPSADQAANSDKEWLNVIATADGAGAIPPDKSNELQGKIAIGLLSGQALIDHARDALGELCPDLAFSTMANAFDLNDVIELRAFNPDGSGGSASYCGRLSDPTQRNEMRDFITLHNGSWGLYFGINPRKSDFAGTTRPAKASDVDARRMIVLDLDLKDTPASDPEWHDTLKALEALAPLMILNSGNGFHVWLKIEDVTGDALGASCAEIKAATQAVGSDDMSDLPRIARLPFSVNLPTKSKRKRGNLVSFAVPILPAPNNGKTPTKQGAKKC